MRCNCENSKCLTCEGKGCKNEAGNIKVMYIGFICDPCSMDMPDKYIVSGKRPEPSPSVGPIHVPIRRPHMEKK
jgi:hypothetical protein